jgi:hypothetical protein
MFFIFNCITEWKGRSLTIYILIFFSRTTVPCAKRGCDTPWMFLFQYQLCLVTLPYTQDDYNCFGLVEQFDIFENIVLQNHWMEWKQIWSKYRYSFGDLLSKLCLLTPSIIQDDHHHWLCNFCFSPPSIIISDW